MLVEAEGAWEGLQATHRVPEVTAAAEPEQQEETLKEHQAQQTQGVVVVVVSLTG